MKAFTDDDFLLQNETAKRLFHGFAKNCPIIDYHNHLSAKDIYERRRYENISQLWLAQDHYKWRAMRVCGVEEKYITGNASDKEKFLSFSQIMPLLIGSPVYHWAHLELKRYFGIDSPLCEQTEEVVWDKTETMLGQEGFDAVSLLEKMQVKVLCTTDDPTDDLQWHLKIAQGDFPFKVLPSFRPDRLLHIEKAQWKTATQEMSVAGWEDLCDALKASLDRFCAVGCRVSDHGFEKFRYACGGEPERVMQKAMRGEKLSEEEIAEYKGAFLRFAAREYERRGMVMQLHFGASRNNSYKLFETIGEDAGGDSIGEATNPNMLGAFLHDLEKTDSLPKTILYGLNPCDNAMLATMAANFASNGAKVRYGAAWWLQDHVRGIENQLDQLLETGQLGKTVGMLTDSRSFTSFVRHEYYRRILCNKLGRIIENGEYPNDIPFIGGLVEDICWKNAARFFEFNI